MLSISTIARVVVNASRTVSVPTSFDTGLMLLKDPDYAAAKRLRKYFSSVANTNIPYYCLISCQGVFCPQKFLLPPVSGAAYEQVSGADSAWETNFAGKTMNHIHTRRKPK